jgi:hypothetical protein
MTQKQIKNNPGRPVLGWFSIGVAVSAFLFLVAIIGVLIKQTLGEQASGSITAAAGGVSAWILYALLVVVATGVILAVVGLVLGERRCWVHAAGVVLNIGAPAAAVATLRLLYG